MKNNILIHTSWGTFALFIFFPAYLVLLDFLSSLITQTDNGLGFVWGALVIAIVCFLSTRFLRLSPDSVWYWSNFIVGKRISIQDIKQIDLRVNAQYSQYGAFPTGTFYFLGENGKVLGKLEMTTFPKKDVAHFLKTINTLHPHIKLNDKAEAYSKGDDELLQKEMNQVYRNVFVAIGIVLVLTAVVAGAIFVIKSI